MPVLNSQGQLADLQEVEVHLDPDAGLEDATAAAQTANVIGIRFPAMKDGRGFSLTRLLRTRLGFTGDLRAVGAIIPDQGNFLVRCGISSFEVDDHFDDAALRENLARFTHVYQRPSGSAQVIPALRHGAADRNQKLIDLRARYIHATAQELLTAAILTEFPGRIALVSSFGAESAVLLHMLAAINRDTDVIFLDTGKLFGETLRYRNALTETLGLTRVHTVSPLSLDLAMRDAKGVLWAENADACCDLRKVEPLARALAPFEAWITGRKRYQSATRTELEAIEWVDGKIKFNPLASWTSADVQSYLDTHQLLRHPLESDGYRSIGCLPCTDRVSPGEGSRDGRWRGSTKVECGIHRSSPVGGVP